jgi:hypothetical protein
LIIIVIFQFINKETIRRSFLSFNTEFTKDFTEYTEFFISFLLGFAPEGGNKKITVASFFILILICLFLLKYKKMDNSNIYFRTITLQDSRDLKLSYLNLGDYKKAILKYKWVKSEDLSVQYNSEIYINQNGNILDQCIYGPKGIAFKDLETFKHFERAMTFSFILSQDKLILMEKVDKSNFEKLQNEFKVDKIKSEYSEALFIMKTNNKVIEFRDVDKFGWIFDSINDFNTMAIEYDLKNIFVAFPAKGKP